MHAKASSESDLVMIDAEAGSAKGAARLANDYALAYLARQRSSYRREIEAAIASTRRQLRRIEAAQAASASAAQRKSSGKGSGSGRAAAGGSAVIQAASLASKINQLESELSVSSVQQINPATPKTARLVSPKPKQNAIFGFVVGLLLAALAVFVLSRLDRRVRSLERARSDLRDAAPRRAARAHGCRSSTATDSRGPPRRCSSRCGGCTRRCSSPTRSSPNGRARRA